MKDWKTTVGVIIGSLLVVAGLVWPEKIDPDTQLEIQTALNEILTGIGVLINLITGWVAKDPGTPAVTE